MHRIKNTTALALILALFFGTFAGVPITNAVSPAPAGTPFTWGYNYYGQLGTSTSPADRRATPAPVTSLNNVVGLAANQGHNLAIKSDGSVWAWGSNAHGKLGANTAPADRSITPVQVNGLSSATAVAAGLDHSLAIKADGTVWGWGFNGHFQLGNGTTNPTQTPVQVSGLAGAAAVAAGPFHSLAAKSDGSVWAWGLNGSGQLGNSNTGSPGMTPLQVNGLGNVVAVAAGNHHSLALKSDGTVWAWGHNSFGQLGATTPSSQSAVPLQVNGLTGVIAIASGLNHSLALKSDGTVWAWGLNNYGQLGATTAPATQSVTPRQVSGLAGVTTIAGGTYHSLALKADGSIWAWGMNTYGQLGAASPATSMTPLQVSDLTGVSKIAGGYHSVAVAANPNQPPVASAGGPYTVNEGASVSVTASGNDPENGPLAYAWDLDDNGSFETPGQTATFSAAAIDGPAGRTIRVRATDQGGLEATGTASVQIVNVAPTAVLSASTPTAEGSAIAVQLSAAQDPSSDDTAAGFGYAFDCGSGYGSFGSAAQASCATTDNGTRTVRGKVRDDDGGETEYTQVVTVDNVAPTATLQAPASVAEGSSIAMALVDPADVSSADTAAGFTYAFDCGSGYGAFGGDAQASCATTDNGTRTVNGAIQDKDGGEGAYSAVVVVTNVAPIVSIDGPAAGTVYAVGSTVSFSGSFTDAGTADTHTAQWSVDGITAPATVVETNGSGTANASHTFTAPGVYTLSLEVTDDDGASGTADTIGGLTAMVVVYDPQGGFVTGGGWITSPAGAHAADPSLTGKASFGFVSKYHKGAAVPTGQTEFQFKAGNLSFSSTAYEWLVVAGARAQYKGSGTINGAGNYGFMLTALDGQRQGGGLDTFRIKIWDKTSGNVVYDNQMGGEDNATPATTLGGGSIVIHD